MRLTWFAILAAMLLFTTAAWADSGISNDPFAVPGTEEEGVDEPFIPEAPWTPGNSAWEEYWVQDIDISGFMQRLKVILTSEEHLGSNPEVAEVAQLFDAMGYFDIAGGFNELEITGDSIKLRSMSEFNHNGDTFLSRYLSIEDAPLRSAKYVSEGDYLLYLALNNVVEKAMTVLSLPELMNEGMESGGLVMNMEMEEFGQVLAMIEALKLEELLSDTLSGELALVIYKVPEFEKLVNGNIMPQDVHAALMIGIDDPEYVLNMANQFGPEIGLVEAEAPEGWHAYSMMGEESVGLAFNDEILIATPNSEATGGHVMAAIENGGMDVRPCLMHLDLDVEALHEQLIHPAALMGIAEMGLEPGDLPSDSMAYLLNVPEPSALGHVTATINHPEGNAYCEFEMKKAVLQWIAFYVGIGLCGAGQAGMLH